MGPGFLVLVKYLCVCHKLRARSQIRATPPIFNVPFCATGVSCVYVCDLSSYGHYYPLLYGRGTGELFSDMLVSPKIVPLVSLKPVALDGTRAPVLAFPKHKQRYTNYDESVLCSIAYFLIDLIKPCCLLHLCNSGCLRHRGDGRKA